MGIKPPIEMMPPQSLSLPERNNAMTVAIPQHTMTVPAPLTTPVTIWGTKRQARYHRALTDMTNAQTEYVRARTELAKSFVGAVRAANEVAELPEICQSDTQIRRLQRERDYVNARREVEEARYGLLATQDEVDKLRKPRMKQIAGKNTAAIDALMKTKVDMEALGEDTSELEQTLVTLQRERV
ncbi:MAG TPA: hypothetical protein VGF53_07995 [Pseudolabrys sp.]|jgi:hypothetical protein